ncbi:MAG: hypothetical protein QNI87_11000 [Erythrobacter sp.]|uniref:hypothetical protein n=1 Tax=Erythrobacter sp. TaxID=1042 RepID=UPI0026087DB0|nr:hypothetical protein [Erythrobacter sp.]MDJ0979047.1 hypothetical protein [Erythrobacter sp.]
MVDTTKQSDQIMGAARQSLAVQRGGGTHRPADSIGKGSAEAKLKNLLKKVRNIVLAIVAIWLGAGIAGAMFNGIGFWGVMAVVVATALAVAVFSSFPKVKPPKREDLKLGSPQQMVANTELWLEDQRKALPPPAVRVVDQLGVQLDALGLQLETIDAAHPAMNDVRELVGEYLPETIDNYKKIPEHLRAEKHTGKSADERLTDSLGKLSGEIDRVTRQLAEGAMDDLAIKDRYLEYRYGGTEALSEEKSA